ncbi:MAG: hypothetical protein Kow0092_31770 [Deferrisomatales bacterium]
MTTFQPLSAIAEVNSKVDLGDLPGDTLVSFVSMADVSESGQLVGRQVRRLEDVRVGYAPVAEGDILFAKIAPCMEKGKGAHAVGLRNGIEFGSTEFHVLRAREPNDARFIYHWLQSPETRRKALAYMGGSAGRQRVQAMRFSRFRIPGIAPAEQTCIAAVPDTVDGAIAKTEAVIAKLKPVRAGLLHDLLTRGLDEHGQFRDPVAHPEQFQDSPLGRIPREWEVTRLGDCSSLVTSGSRGWAAYYSDDGPIFPRIGNLTREHINLQFDDVAHVQPPAGGEGARTRVEEGDILISITAGLGIIGVIPPQFGDAYVNQHVALVRPGQRVVSRWMGRFLASGPGSNQFRMLNDSGAKAGLNLPAVESLWVALPTNEEQLAASEALDGIDEAIDSEERAARKLQRLKSGLLSDLLTGRVRVPEGTLTPAGADQAA